MRLKIAAIFCLSLPFAVSASGETCNAKYGEIVNVERCGEVELPGFKVRFTGITRPFPIKTMACWNYEALSGLEQAAFRHCHTGELGGRTEFILTQRKWQVEFDVLPPGSTLTGERGLRFTPVN